MSITSPAPDKAVLVPAVPDSSSAEPAAHGADVGGDANVILDNHSCQHFGETLSDLMCATVFASFGKANARQIRLRLHYIRGYERGNPLPCGEEKVCRVRRHFSQCEYLRPRLQQRHQTIYPTAIA